MQHAAEQQAAIHLIPPTAGNVEAARALTSCFLDSAWPLDIQDRTKSGKKEKIGTTVYNSNLCFPALPLNLKFLVFIWI